jgi:hypothetical protein
MLNIEPIGGEGIPFYAIVFFSIREREIRDHNRGG